MKAVVTDHGLERVMERVGLNRSAVGRHIQTVYEKGLKYCDMNKKCQKVFNALYNKYPESVGARVYGEFVFIFANHVLLTVMELYPRHKDMFNANRRAVDAVSV